MKTAKFWFPLLLVSAMVSLCAAEAAPAAEAPTTWKDTLITLAIAAGTFGAAMVGWLFKTLRGKVVKNDAQDQAWSALEAGVTDAYHTLYQELVKANGDRKFTEEEKKQLRLHAIEKAKQIATGPGLQMLKVTAVPVLMDWVERIVLNRKTQSGA